MKPLTIPTVHLGGTSAQNLIDPLLTATKALRAAMRALDATEPNSRDYYPQGADAFQQAVREQDARGRKLIEVSDELYEIIEAVQEQADARVRQRR